MNHSGVWVIARVDQWVGRRTIPTYRPGKQLSNGMQVIVRFPSSIPGDIVATT
jgi:hypothetical protein